MYSAYPTYAVRGTAPVVLVASGDAFSEVFKVNGDGVNSGSLQQTLGFLAEVTVAGAGTFTITPQTAVTGANPADATQWLDCSLSVVAGVAPTAGTTTRSPLVDFVFDVVRFKVTGDASAAGSITLSLLGNQPVSLA